ncbi:hypothetical protein KKF55_00210 [Patescibacteria group bacterium]|nr:hypothetical protein [Patescibacteria group bacterium]
MSTIDSTGALCVRLADFLLIMFTGSRLPAEAHEVSAGWASPPQPYSSAHGKQHWNDTEKYKYITKRGSSHSQFSFLFMQ